MGSDNAAPGDAFLFHPRRWVTIPRWLGLHAGEIAAMSEAASVMAEGSAGPGDALLKAVG